VLLFRLKIDDNEHNSPQALQQQVPLKQLLINNQTSEKQVLYLGNGVQADGEFQFFVPHMPSSGKPLAFHLDFNSSLYKYGHSSLR
jgi:hypothetical protein